MWVTHAKRQIVKSHQSSYNCFGIAAKQCLHRVNNKQFLEEVEKQRSIIISGGTVCSPLSYLLAFIGSWSSGLLNIHTTNKEIVIETVVIQHVKTNMSEKQ